MKALFALFSLGMVFSTSCKTTHAKGSGGSEVKDFSGSSFTNRRQDGLYDVVCKGYVREDNGEKIDGMKQIVSAEDVGEKRICQPAILLYRLTKVGTASNGQQTNFFIYAIKSDINSHTSTYNLEGAVFPTFESKPEVTADTQRMVEIHRCLKPDGQTFVSTSQNCDGNIGSNQGSLGFIYSKSDSYGKSKELWRCYSGSSLQDATNIVVTTQVQSECGGNSGRHPEAYPIGYLPSL